VLVVVAVLAAGAAGIAIGASLGGDDDGGSADGPAPSTTDDVVGPPAPTATSAPISASVAPPDPIATGGLDGAALELAEAYNQALQLTYHATYETDPASGNEPVVVDIHRRPPLARRDTVTGAGEQALNISEYRTAENAHVGCLLSPDEGGQDLCVVAPPTGVDPANPIMGVIDPAAMDVTAEDVTVAGEAARCFYAATPAGIVAEACFDGDGIPVAIDGGDGRLVRVALERGVDDDAFVLPAAPSPGGPVVTAPASG
jgi:hypothetical protein